MHVEDLISHGKAPRVPFRADTSSKVQYHSYERGHTDKGHTGMSRCVQKLLSIHILVRQKSLAQCLSTTCLQVALTSHGRVWL